MWKSYWQKPLPTALPQSERSIKTQALPPVTHHSGACGKAIGKNPLPTALPQLPLQIVPAVSFAHAQ